MAHVKEM